MRQKEEASTAAFSPFVCYTSLSTPAHFHLGPHHYRSIISHISNSGRARRCGSTFALLSSSACVRREVGRRSLFLASHSEGAATC